MGGRRYRSTASPAGGLRPRSRGRQPTQAGAGQLPPASLRPPQNPSAASRAWRGVLPPGRPFFFFRRAFRMCPGSSLSLRRTCRARSDLRRCGTRDPFFPFMADSLRQIVIHGARPFGLAPPLIGGWPLSPSRTKPTPMTKDLALLHRGPRGLGFVRRTHTPPSLAPVSRLLPGGVLLLSLLLLLPPSHLGGGNSRRTRSGAPCIPRTSGSISRPGWSGWPGRAAERGRAGVGPPGGGLPGSRGGGGWTWWSPTKPGRLQRLRGRDPLAADRGVRGASGGRGRGWPTTDDWMEMVVTTKLGPHLPPGCGGAGRAGLFRAGAGDWASRVSGPSFRTVGFPPGVIAGAGGPLRVLPHRAGRIRADLPRNHGDPGTGGPSQGRWRTLGPDRGALPVWPADSGPTSYGSLFFSHLASEAAPRIHRPFARAVWTVDSPTAFDAASEVPSGAPFSQALPRSGGRRSSASARQRAEAPDRTPGRSPWGRPSPAEAPHGGEMRSSAQGGCWATGPLRWPE